MSTQVMVILGLLIIVPAIVEIVAMRNSRESIKHLTRNKGEDKK